MIQDCARVTIHPGFTTAVCLSPELQAVQEAPTAPGVKRNPRTVKYVKHGWQVDIVQRDPCNDIT